MTFSRGDLNKLTGDDLIKAAEELAQRRFESTPDNASQMYIEKAIKIAEKYPVLFDYKDPVEAFVLTDDFLSSGRISGAESIPIAKLNVGQFHTVNSRRLQVNDSVTGYQRELAYLTAII